MPSQRNEWCGGLRELVPGELLGQEAVDPGAAEDLRKLAVVAERVGAPVLAAAPPEPRLERPLAVEQLPHERLARRQVAVRLHPRAADDLPAAFAHALAHAREQIRRVLLEPRVVLRRGRRETVLGVAVHQRELVRERADDLAARLGERPQPRRVEVGVADRRHPVHAPGVAVGEQAGEDLARGGVLAALPGGAEAVELGEQADRPRRARDPGSRLELAQRLEVPRRLPRGGVEAHELAAREPHRVVVAHPRVAGHLDRDLHALAAGRRVGEPRLGPPRRRARVEALQRLAVAPQRRLAAAVPGQLDARAGPRLRDRGRDPEPVRRPLRPERLPELGLPVGERLRRVPPDPLGALAHQQPVGRRPPRDGRAPAAAPTSAPGGAAPARGSGAP